MSAPDLRMLDLVCPYFLGSRCPFMGVAINVDAEEPEKCAFQNVGPVNLWDHIQLNSPYTPESGRGYCVLYSRSDL